MKILLLSDSGSSHTYKWVKSLAERGCKIFLFSLSNTNDDLYSGISLAGYKEFDLTRQRISQLSKLKYLKVIPSLKRVIREFKPDILHAHYATSYGLIGALSGFHPFIISVWGSDVYDFPEKGFFSKSLLKFNLAKADYICSTSHVMAKRTQKFTSKMIEVIPFGVDTNAFRNRKTKSLFDEDAIVIGTIKKMEEKYGIRYLIEAFKILKEKHPQLPLRLLLVGDGSEKEFLINMVKNYKLKAVTRFTGNIPHEHIPDYHNMLDIPVYVSTLDSESFGVSVIESSACEKAVVVSNVGGLVEVVNDGVTGIIVPHHDAQRTANAIEKLLLNKSMRDKMGVAGRERVMRLYNWNECVDKMIAVYESLLKKN